MALLFLLELTLELEDDFNFLSIFFYWILLMTSFFMLVMFSYF